MAVAFDGETVQVAAQGTNVTTHSVTNKTTAGSNRIGVVAIVTGSDTVTGAEWGTGNAMTLAVKVANATDGRTANIWYYIAPPTGATTVTVTSSGGGTHSVMMASSFNGAHQTTQDGDTSTDSGTATPATVDVTSAVGEMVVDCLYFLGAGTAPSSNTTELGHSDDGTWFGSSSYVAGAATTTMSYGLTSATRWSIAGWAIKPAAAGATNDALIRIAPVGWS